MEEKIVERIRKLLAKAEGTDNEHEADAFMAQAMRLMARHRMDGAQIRAGMGTGSRPPEIVRAQWDFSNDDGLGLVRGGAACDIAKVFGCSGLIATHPEPGVAWSAILYGTQQAADAALLVLRSLSIQWEAAARRAWSAHADQIIERIRAEQAYHSFQEYRPPYSTIPRPGAYTYNPFDASWRIEPARDPWGRTNPYRAGPTLTAYQEEMEQLISHSGLPQSVADDMRRRYNIPVGGQRPGSSELDGLHAQLAPERVTAFMSSYITGYAARALERLKGVQREAEAEVPGAGLVLKSDHDRAEAARDEAFPHLGTASKSAMDYEAYAAGQRDGSGADLGGTRFGYGAERAPRGIGM